MYDTVMKLFYLLNREINYKFINPKSQVLFITYS